MSDQTAGELIKDRLIEIASFEGPDSYWSIQAVRNRKDDTFTVWICNQSDEPIEPVASGVGRWESYGHNSTIYNEWGAPKPTPVEGFIEKWRRRQEGLKEGMTRGEIASGYEIQTLLDELEGLLE